MKYFKFKYLRIFLLISSVNGFLLSSIFAEESENIFSCDGKKILANGSEVIKKSQNAYKKVSGLSADFEQKSVLLGMTANYQSSGTLKFLRPGKMDWEYLVPKVQKFVSDGEQVWFYEPELNQVSTGKLVKSFDSQVPVSFLLGVGDLDKSFSASKVCSSKHHAILFLKPIEPQPNLKEFVLLLDANTYLPAGAKIVDAGETSTEFVFKNIKLENNFDPNTFKFNPPSGVDVVGQ